MTRKEFSTLTDIQFMAYAREVYLHDRSLDEIDLEEVREKATTLEFDHLKLNAKKYGLRQHGGKQVIPGILQEKIG